VRPVGDSPRSGPNIARATRDAQPDTLAHMTPSSSPALTGGCGCGAVRFALSEPAMAAAYCHCTRCQKRTGTGSQASARVAPGSVTITQGAEHLGAWTLHDGLAKTFCRRCGSHLFAVDRETAEVRVVRMAAFDGDPGVRPAAHQFVADAPEWETLPDDGLPRFDAAIPSA
jgi:hypothetical protein